MLNVKKSFNEREYGFSLIEIIVSMGLLLLVVSVFTPMIMNSYRLINESGQRSADLLESRGDLEQKIAGKEFADEKDIPLTFGATTKNVRGGKVDSDDFGAAVPIVASVRIEPDLTSATDLTLNREITVFSSNMSFTEDFPLSPEYTVKDLDGIELNWGVLEVNQENLASFEFPEELIEPDKSYDIFIATERRSAETSLTIR